MKFRKMVTMTLYARQQKRHRCEEQTFGLHGVQVRVGLFERMALKRTLSYVKQIASPGWMHETGCSGLLHWDDPEGWDGEEGGRGVQDRGHMYTCG